MALITGGDSGIGRAVAAIYVREGADVALVYLRKNNPNAFTKTLAQELLDKGIRVNAVAPARYGRR